MNPEDEAHRIRMLAERVPPRILYCPLRPTGVQLAFLWLDTFEAFIGGAAGGGKSMSLLMAALQYVDVPGYSALLLRRSYAELTMDGALIDLGHEWLDNSDARWKESEHKWTFPSGANLQFGHMETSEAFRRYQSAGFHFIGFDELTHFTKRQYTFMFSRCRRPSEEVRLKASPDGYTAAQVPLRVRGASNPGGIGHEWCKERFIDQETRHPTALVIRSAISDNRYLDRESYVRTLMEIPGVERDRMLEGDWDATEEGNIFTVAKLQEVLTAPSAVLSVRRWDLAASEPTPAYPDPDWTVGVRMELGERNEMTVTDCVADRVGSGAVQELVRQTAIRDGRDTVIYMPQDPGQAGKDQVAVYARDLLGFTVTSMIESGSKEVRARPAAAAIDNGALRILKGCPHIDLIRSQLRRFPTKGVHDDCVDAISGAYAAVAAMGGPATFGTVVDAPAEVQRPWSGGPDAQTSVGGGIVRPWHPSRQGGAW